MSQAQTTQSLLKEYQKRLREDMRALRDNFQEIIMAAKGDEKLTDKLQLSHTTSAIYDKCQIQGTWSLKTGLHNRALILK